MTAKNPYFVAGELAKDSARFLGRVVELNRIRDSWRKGESVAVYGLPGIGKSSLLYQIVQQADRLPSDLVALYLNLPALAPQGPLGVLNTALQSFEECLALAQPFPRLARVEDFTAHVDRLVAEGHRPALCLDGVEALTRKQGFDRHFFECLYTLGTDHRVLFVTASRYPLTAMFQHKGDPLPFCALFTPLELAGIREMWAATLLIKPFRLAGGYAPSLDDCHYALTLSGRYPLYMQIVAYHLFELSEKGETLDRSALRDAFTQTAAPHFRALWEALTPEQREAVWQCLERGGEDVAPEVQGALLRSGLAQKAPHGLRLFSDAFADGLKSGMLIDSKPGLASWPIYTYMAVAMVCAIVVGIVASLAVPEERFWLFFSVPTLVLTAALILVDRWAEGRFLEGVARLLGEG